MATNKFVRSPSQRDLRTRRDLARLADLDIQITPVPATIFLDTFRSANNVSLATHTPDVGNLWISDAGSTVATVLSNDPRVKFDQNGHGGNMVWYTTTGFPNVTGYVTGMVPTGSNAACEMGLLFRWSDTLNYTIVTMGQKVGTTGGVAIYEQAGGVFTQRALKNFTMAFDTAYTLQATISGTTLSALVDNDQDLAVSYDALVVNTGGGAHGVRFGGFTTSDFLYAIAPFKLTTP